VDQSRKLNAFKGGYGLMVGQATEQLRDRRDVDPGGARLVGERVPQPVRVHALLDSGLGGEPACAATARSSSGCSPRSRSPVILMS
jgi:hypothetical protein